MSIVQTLLMVRVPESVRNPYPSNEPPKKKKVDRRPRVNALPIKARYRAAMIGRGAKTARDWAADMKLSKTVEVLRNLERKYGCVAVTGYTKGANHKHIELWEWVGE